LVACRQTDLAQQPSLAPATFSRLVKLHGSSERVRGLRQPTGRFLDLGYVVKGCSRTDPLPGNVQSFGLSEQSSFVVGRAS
jgi:hypothetical protein